MILMFHERGAVSNSWNFTKRFLSPCVCVFFCVLVTFRSSFGGSRLGTEDTGGNEKLSQRYMPLGHRGR